MSEERYYNRLAAAYVRGHTMQTGIPQLPNELMDVPLAGLTDGQIEQIMDAGRRADLKIYRLLKDEGC